MCTGTSIRYQDSSRWQRSLDDFFSKYRPASIPSPQWLDTGSSIFAEFDTQPDQANLAIGAPMEERAGGHRRCRHKKKANQRRLGGRLVRSKPGYRAPPSLADAAFILDVLLSIGVQDSGNDRFA
jgi:hypothetical protein